MTSARLADVAEIVAGGRRKWTGLDFVEAGYPAFGAGGLNGYLTEFEFDRAAVVLSSIGARCGKCFLADGRWASLANTQVILPNPKVADARFLWYQLNDEDRWHRSGTAQPFIKPSDVKAHKVYLPSIEEQQRIARVLDAADALRAKRRQALAKLDTLTQAIFIDMFGDPTANPHRWATSNLGDLVAEGTSVTYGIVQAGEEFPGGTPYIRTGDLIDGEIRCDGLRRTDPSIAQRFPRSRVARGEIVMSIRATVGTTAMVPAELEGANLTQGTARIAPGERVLGSYLLEYLRTGANQQWIQRQVKGATFREITLARLRELPVLVPPLDLQHQFARRVESALSIVTPSNSSLSALGVLFASLQHRAFRGEL